MEAGNKRHCTRSKVSFSTARSVTFEALTQTEKEIRRDARSRRHPGMRRVNGYVKKQGRGEQGGERGMSKFRAIVRSYDT